MFYISCKVFRVMLILTLVYTIVNGYNNKILLLSVFGMHVFVYAAVLSACKPFTATLLTRTDTIKHRSINAYIFLTECLTH